MKEEFDLSRYLNHPEKSDGSRILSKIVSKAVSTKQEVEQSGQSESSPHSPKGKLPQSLHVGTFGVRCPSLGRLRGKCFKFLGVHSPPTFGRIQRGYRTLAQTLIPAFRAISDEMNNRHSQKARRTSNGSKS